MSEKSQLISRLRADKALREAYIRSKCNVSVPSQIRALRRRRFGTQEALAFAAEMKQSRISASEQPGTKFNIETLIRLAATFRVGLLVKFVPFSQMLKEENEFSQDSFDVITIDHDKDFEEEDEQIAKGNKVIPIDEWQIAGRQGVAPAGLHKLSQVPVKRNLSEMESEKSERTIVPEQELSLSWVAQMSEQQSIGRLSQ